MLRLEGESTQPFFCRNPPRVSLSSDGKLFLAPGYDQFFDTAQPYIFSMVRDKSGNLYVGTGHEGKVFKVDPRGNGTVYFESKELDIFALALDAADTLYVGSSPDGKVYKVTGPKQGTDFCNVEDKYIWSLLFDDAGNLLVGSGGRGIIYKVDRSGKKSVFYDSDDNHVVALARDRNGNVLAGSRRAAALARFTPLLPAPEGLRPPLRQRASLLPRERGRPCR